MKKILLLCAGLLIMSASSALAQIQVRWNDCELDGGAMQKTSTCATNGGVNRLVVSYTPGTSIPDFVSVDGILDLQFDNGPLPPWWEFKNAGACRQSAAGIGADINVLPNFGTSCFDTWDGGNSATALFTGYAANFNGDPQRARAVFAIARAASNPTAISSGQNYFGWIWQISNASTLTCAGCADPVAIWAPEMTLRGVSGVGYSVQSTNAVGLVGSPNDGHACAGWNNGSCTATPTKVSTWGNVKALYR
jgi:hypothetical protein